MKKIITYPILSVLLLLWTASSCKRDDPNAERKDYIRVYENLTSEHPIDRTNLPVRGGSVTLYIRSNANFQAKWQDGRVPAWASITRPRLISEGLWEITVTAEKLSEDALYERRSGVLMLTDAGRFLGNYFTVNQGLVKRVGTDFSWLAGSLRPNETISDVLIQNWSNAQKKYGYTSTLIEGQESAWCYSKSGYVRLGGNNGIGADLIMPHTPSFQGDSLLVVSFKAVVQNGPSIGDFYGQTEGMEEGSDSPGSDPEPEPDPGPDTGGGTEPILPMPVIRKAGPAATEVDDGTLTVVVEGGGVIRDIRQTSITITDLPTYDRGSADFPSDMFKGASYLVFVASTPSNPITSNTTIRIIAGSMSPEPAVRCSRIFIDDLYVFRTDTKTDEDLFVLNDSKSGKDKVLGGAAEN